MKKILVIVVLGLTISCSDSETDYKKKSKMIEICADHEYPKNYRDYNSAVKDKPLKIKLQKGMRKKMHMLQNQLFHLVVWLIQWK